MAPGPRKVGVTREWEPKVKTASGRRKRGKQAVKTELDEYDKVSEANYVREKIRLSKRHESPVSATWILGEIRKKTKSSEL